MSDVSRQVPPVRDMADTACPVYASREHAQRHLRCGGPTLAEEAHRRDRGRSLTDVPEIVSLRRRAEEIRQAELQRAEAKLRRLRPARRRAIEAITARIVSQFLHEPAERVKEAVARSDGALYLETLRYLFALDEEGA